MQTLSLVILAAGDSTRLNLGVKKQNLRLKDEPLWLFVAKRLSKFYNFDKVIVAGDDIKYMSKFSSKFEYCSGGATRQESLKNALDLIKSEFVMVSDGARAKVPKKMFKRLIDEFRKNEFDCISPFLSVVDTTILNEEFVDRNEIKLLQTPQISRVSLLKKALNSNEIFSDDSSAIKFAGGKISFVKGSKKAHKITFANDLKKLKLPPVSNEIFIGNGFDVHEFGENRALILGGVKVHESMGVKAHSDGDVVAHALCDAIFGAASLGDIGEHFSDKDAKYKNANSIELLKQGYKMARNRGFELINADITIIAQTPKLKEFKEEISSSLAKALNVKAHRINTKATTTEHLGFVGRKEGIAVLASVSLKYFDWTK